MSFPTTIDDIPKLEVLNNIMINCYEYADSKFKLLYRSDRLSFIKEVNLLVLKKSDNISHFILIKDLRAFSKKQSNSGTFCKQCLNIFNSQELFDNHLEISESCSQSSIQNIVTPTVLSKRNDLVRMNCDDKFNLQWSIAAAIHPLYETDGRFCTRIAPYQKVIEYLNIPNIQYTILNKSFVLGLTDYLQTNINIFTFHQKKDKYEFLPYIIPQTTHSKNIDLLMFNRDNKHSFMIIKDLSSLYYARTRNKHYVCRRCLDIFLVESKLNEHQILCKNAEIQKTCFPSSDDAILKFKNFRKQMEALFICFVDFEALLKKTDDDESIKTHEHIPMAYAYKLYSSLDNITKETQVYTGVDCATVLIHKLIEEYEAIEYLFSLNTPLEMTEDDEIAFDDADICHICGENFEESNRIKCKDHCHITG